ncbi:MAG: hypothetical protein WCZ47_03810 [Bacilli bacterium]|jgi:V/A-type H+-transporting ATPase subunit E|nr:hypothetical protein [Bacilli bacterium]NLN80427.1 hypothetical protein [Erysipelotrichia bacterium]
MSIYKKIAKKGEEESNLIKQKAEKDAEFLRHQIINEAEKKAALIVEKAKVKSASEIAQQDAILDLEFRQTIAALKNKAIDDLFNDVLEHFKNLKEKDLLDFVVSLIKEENIQGDEVLRVSKNEYDKYLKALSTKPKGKLVDLDLLNKSLGKKYTLSLENIPSNEDEGFILIGQTFDLNFSVVPILAKIRKEKEKQLFELLFKDNKK